MTQCDLILEHMKRNGGITQADAIQLYGCYRLGARIWDLRERGIKINRSMVAGVNRYGAKTSYARYWIADHDPAA